MGLTVVLDDRITDSEVVADSSLHSLPHRLVDPPDAVVLLEQIG